MAGDAITKQELFARLAGGHAAGITVVTPNRRLAQVLKSDFDRFQVKKSLQVWEDADILPFPAFVERRYEDTLYSDSVTDLPRLLGAAQERAIWESMLAGSGLLAVPEAAAECAKAWRLAHAWRIDGVLEKYPGNEDTAAFARWAKEFLLRCSAENFIDSARLPDLKNANSGKKPKLLVAYGFDILPPQVADFFARFEISNFNPGRRKSNSRKTPFPSARHELEAAAKWARARLEGGARRIGVVVPDLERRRREVVRVFSCTMRPGGVLPDAERKAMPFNVSLGEPLSGCAPVAAALLLLEFSFHEQEFENISRLIRSPFIAGAESESAARARLDARVRRKLGARVSLPKLIGEAGACPLLRSSLENLFSFAKTQSDSPNGWARQFTDLLEAAGFPGERVLDSGEFQARAKFNEILAEFARLGLVLGRISAAEALARLRRLCAETLFQRETPDAPIQVVGILESAGLEFDCLWVSGLTDEAWPLAARPNPFLPVALQKKAQIPEASAEGSLALDRRITEGWLGAADEVVFSWPGKEEDRDLAPSPLIVGVPLGALDAVDVPAWRDLIFSSANLATIEDGKAPAITSTEIRGGTRVLADQAACPFRAFARHRLGAEALETPAAGLDAADRGRLLHELMKNLWSELKTSAALSGNLQPVIARAAAAAVAELGIEGRFAELEKRRLEAIAREWLEIEKERESFEVVAIERPAGISIASLLLRGRIDRMDRLEGGSHAIIDYKSGRATPNDWLGERPDEPQMPLYAVSAQEGVSTVAYAKLQRGEMKWAGFSLKEKEIPGVKQAKSWPGLLEGWQAALDSLAAGFARGDARVDPKRGPATCRNCGLQPLCRVHEKLNALSHDDEGGD